MPVSIRTERMDDEDRRVLAELGRVAVRPRKGWGLPAIVAIVGLACLPLGRVVGPKDPVGGLFVVVASLTAGIVGASVGIARYRTNRRFDREGSVRRAVMEWGEINVISYAADLLIPVPNIDEDCDGALLRVDAERFLLITSWWGRGARDWDGNRFASEVTVRWLPTIGEIRETRGERDVPVGEELFDDQRRKLESFIASGNAWGEPFLIVPAAVIGQARM